MIFTIYSSRRYGEPKLKKPIELKGIPQSFSETFIYRKCSFPVFVIKDADQIWIKSTDWFSPSFIPPDISDIGKPQNAILKQYFPEQKARPQTFGYDNNYASVVLQCESWILFSGVYKDAEEYDHGYLFDRTWPTPIWLRNRMTRCVEERLGLPPLELMCSDLERFFERVISRLQF